MASRRHIVAICLCAYFCAAHTSTEYNRYLAQIFQKYGSGGTISFEGLEHLMFSLGLGHIEFEPTHTIAEHRPKGYNDTGANATDLSVHYYLEQQSNGLLRNGSDTDVTNDVQLSREPTNNRNSNRNHTEPQPTTDGPLVVEFREMHDPKHRHPRENYADVAGSPLPTTSTCLSPKSLLSLLVDHEDLHKHKLYRKVLRNGEASAAAHNSDEEYNEFINSVRITPKAFMKLCPALLAQVDNGVCVRPAPLVLGDVYKMATIWNAWIYATISMFVLSACGLLALLLVPLMKTVAYQEILKFFVALAVGTLAGDALMHLLPHALFKEERALEAGSSGHEHTNRAAFLCACSFLAALFMFLLENLIPLLKGEPGGHGHSHGHGHRHSSAKHGPETPATEPPPSRELNVMLQETKLDRKTPEQPLTPVAFMVIIGDGLHNLTDGLAIGAAFASDPVTGLATAFAVLCHELPHELGDFALLLQSGVSLRRALYMNLISSVLSFVGMSIGLFIAGIGDGMTQWIYAATAGSFLYIAFADLIPTMSMAHNKELAYDMKGIMIQILGILLGGLIMLVIAVNEHELEGLFKGF